MKPLVSTYGSRRRETGGARADASSHAGCYGSKALAQFAHRSLFRLLCLTRFKGNTMTFLETMFRSVVQIITHTTIWVRGSSVTLAWLNRWQLRASTLEMLAPMQSESRSFAH